MCTFQNCQPAKGRDFVPLWFTILPHPPPPSTPNPTHHRPRVRPRFLIAPGFFFFPHNYCAEPLWTDPCIKSGTSMRELICASRKKEKRGVGGGARRQGMNGRTFCPNPRKRGKSHHHHHHIWDMSLLFCSVFVSKNCSFVTSKKDVMICVLCFIKLSRGHYNFVSSAL